MHSLHRHHWRPTVSSTVYEVWGRPLSYLVDPVSLKVIPHMQQLLNSYSCCSFTDKVSLESEWRSFSSFWSSRGLHIISNLLVLVCFLQPWTQLLTDLQIHGDVLTPQMPSSQGNLAGNFLSSDIYLVCRRPVYFLLLRSVGGIPGVWDEVFPMMAFVFGSDDDITREKGTCLKQLQVSEWTHNVSHLASRMCFQCAGLQHTSLSDLRTMKCLSQNEIQGWSIPVLSFHSWEDWSLGKGKTFPKWFQGRTRVRIQIFSRVGSM